MLDFYFKQRLLGWAPEVPHVLMTHDLGKLPNKILLHQFVKLGIQCISDGRQFASFYDQHKLGNELPWGQLPLEERLALTDDFWTYDFPDGEILTYTHGAARIQQQWEAQKRAPLMQLDEQQKLAARTLLDQMGVPRDAWFVCVHVREGGFYKNWNHKYPSARDGTIEDFYPAIKAIVDRGGWVVRMGDRSMTPLRPMERVVDYAHGPFKCEIGDIVLAASAKFLLGTNSGFATLPGIYGVPNVLTNWVPIQLPLWFGQDLMTPKLMWNREEERYLSFEEMFSTRLGATQNVREFPHQIEVRSNTSDEICAVAMEMLDRLDGKIRYSPADEAPQRAYFDIAERHGSYRGSRIGRDFLASYRKLLPDGSKPPVAKLTTDVAA